MQFPFSEKTISVSELSAAIKACMDAPIFKSLEVFGEVSGFKFSGPHAYFTLKDKDSQLQCVCFNARKTYNPKDGESVIVKGSLDYWTKGGRLSFQAASIQPVGQGALALEFERLKQKLNEEGLFAAEHKKPIPRFCKNVLVLTSKTGAVIRDIVTTIRRKNPILDIVVRDVRVQGEGAAHEIAAVLKRVDLLGYDVIVIARGGGSLEDLAPFYDEELVRAIYAMSTPVVSAVGHETDFSLCDFVADMRAPTPTAAGELVAYDYNELVVQLRSDVDRLTLGAKRAFERKSSRAQIAFDRLRVEATSLYADRERKIERCLQSARQSIERKIVNAEKAYELLAGKLDGLSPLKVLSRGYFRLMSGERTISAVNSVKVGEEIKAVGGDGSITATVTDILQEKDKFAQKGGNHGGDQEV